MRLAEIVDRLTIDSRKLTDYALNPNSPLGRHKAKVFKELLGITAKEHAALMAQIKEDALEEEATFHSEDEFGQRYTVDLLVQGAAGRKAIVRTGWLVYPDLNEARLITLYVRKAGSKGVT